eukprot:CAMPEP_0177308472 /NCGR_PEP_ID=MMETSP0368-20130122/8780_1 /TAXON_ID=447022 ORGANISM="Scrippsiella hangoei-like, Strain SHHI-4" /NCGR_SAMPLE_ID=MMETSP0368 /ASSEMBLY_ACC=CAM_ASM_000363 /LENGTH=97 /DNA_ID=CAMNT_0018767279 /DNA_START=27 /DNA_END=318 /DNA_ORIENTATION=-
MSQAKCKRHPTAEEEDGRTLMPAVHVVDPNTASATLAEWRDVLLGQNQQVAARRAAPFQHHRGLKHVARAASVHGHGTGGCGIDVGEQLPVQPSTGH